MSKKIGIMTIFHDNQNYGGALQAYSLCNYIELLGYKCEQIDYVTKREQVTFASKFTHYVYHPQDILKKIYKIYYCKNESSKDLTQQLFTEYLDKIPHSSSTYNYQTIKETCELYDAYIVGSDQVWNPDFCDEGYLLTFTNNKPKIAIAASAGKNFLQKKELQVISSAIANFSAVSVREKTLANQLRTCTNKEIDVILDPVFLFDREFWSKKAQNIIINDKYVFCYLLSSNKETIKKALFYAHKHNCKLLMISSFVPSELHRLVDIAMINIGPNEFLTLIKNAEIVLTDSFHATAFSIIFNKQFLAFNRSADNFEMNSRIKLLLDEIDESQRYIDTEQLKQINLPDIDYKRINEIISIRKEYSKNWVKTNLQVSFAKIKRTL